MHNNPRLNLQLGMGAAYHQVISIESNNYFTDLELEVKNENELDLAAFSFKFFVGLEAAVYKNIIFGVEPYVAFQERRARYTPSTFLADEGNYNVSSGINFSVRF